MSQKAKASPGDTYGLWTLLEPETLSGANQKWKVRCACGTIRTKILSKLTTGQSRSCGCTRVARHQAVLSTLSGRV